MKKLFAIAVVALIFVTTLCTTTFADCNPKPLVLFAEEKDFTSREDECPDTWEVYLFQEAMKEVGWYDSGLAGEKIRCFFKKDTFFLEKTPEEEVIVTIYVSSQRLSACAWGPVGTSSKWGEGHLVMFYNASLDALKEALYRYNASEMRRLKYVKGYGVDIINDSPLTLRVGDYTLSLLSNEGRLEYHLERGYKILIASTLDDALFPIRPAPGAITWRGKDVIASHPRK